MKKKLKSSGNGWELYLPKPLMKLLGYDPKETKVLITSKNKTLFVEPIEEFEIEKYKNNMIRNFQKSGGNCGLYLPTPLIEVIEINPEIDFVEIEINENKFSIKKALIEGEN